MRHAPNVLNYALRVVRTPSLGDGPSTPRGGSTLKPGVSDFSWHSLGASSSTRPPTSALRVLHPFWSSPVPALLIEAIHLAPSPTRLQLSVVIGKPCPGE